MQTFDLGIMPAAAAERVRRTLDGRTYMRFRVDLGIISGGMNVTITTDYEATAEEILTLALYIVATDLAEGA